MCLCSVKLEHWTWKNIPNSPVRPDFSRTCKVFFPAAHISSSIAMLLLLTFYSIFMKNLLSIDSACSKYSCTTVSLQLSNYKQYFIHILCRYVYDVPLHQILDAQLEWLQFFFHPTGIYRKPSYGLVLLFYITKIHSQQVHIFSKIYYHTSVRILN